jgi:hypothetical protein
MINSMMERRTKRPLKQRILFTHGRIIILPICKKHSVFAFKPTSALTIESCSIWHNLQVIWLGNKRGFLNDWVTQRWVQLAGRKVILKDHSWLQGPIGNTRQIGKDFFIDYAHRNNLQIQQSGVRGLVEDLTILSILLSTSAL